MFEATLYKIYSGSRGFCLHAPTFCGKRAELNSKTNWTGIHLTSLYVVLFFAPYEHWAQLHHQFKDTKHPQRLVKYTGAHGDKVLFKKNQQQPQTEIEDVLYKSKKRKVDKILIRHIVFLFLFFLNHPCFQVIVKYQYVVVPILILLEQNGQTYTGHMMQVTKSTKSYSDKSFCSKGNNDAVLTDSILWLFSCHLILTFNCIWHLTTSCYHAFKVKLKYPIATMKCDRDGFKKKKKS